MNADKNSAGVAVGNFDAVSEGDKNIAVASHDHTVSLFLQHVPDHAGDFQRVDFFIAVVAPASRIFSAMPGIEDHGAEGFGFFDVGWSHHRVNQVDQVGLGKQKPPTCRHQGVAENKQDGVDAAFLRARFDHHFDFGVFQRDGFTALGLAETVEVFNASQGDVFFAFVADSLPLEAGLRP